MFTVDDRSLWENYLPNLYAAQSDEERFQVYGDYITSLGFSAAAYTFTPRLQLEAMSFLPLVFLYTNQYPLEFIKEYQQERYDNIDFTIRKSLKEGETKPMDWREHELLGLVSKEETFLIHLAKEKYGIKNGISIPAMLNEKGAAGFAIISFQDDEIFNNIKKANLPKLIAASRAFHDSNFSDLKRFILPIYNSLSPREIQLLTYKTSGKPMKNIKDHLGDETEGAASNALHRLKRKLGNINNDRLIYLFTLLNSLDIPNIKSP